MEDLNYLSDKRISLNKKDFSKVIDSLHENIFVDESRQKFLPSRDNIIKAIENIKIILFPRYFGKPESLKNIKEYLDSLLNEVSEVLLEEVRKAFYFDCKHVEGNYCQICDERSIVFVKDFINILPRIQESLIKDAKLAYEWDPAAKSVDEVVICYPGFYAIFSYRVAHKFYISGVPIIPRIITEHAHSLTGVDIHPGATIGVPFFIDHGTGIVIGETCKIGNRVRIYQGVTLGAKSFSLDESGNPIKGIERHPIIEDEVIIYSGATILGRVTIGKGSIIGGNVWLTKSVPPYSKVVQSDFKQEFKNDKENSDKNTLEWYI